MANGEPSRLDPDQTRVLAAIARCEADLDARGLTVVDPLAGRLRALATRTQRGRLPRVTIAGRRGAGKSSLLNAVADAQLAAVGAVEDATGRARSYFLQRASLELEWIDTGGLRAGGVSALRAEALVEALLDAPPDVLVFAHHASEADAAIDAELSDLAAAIDAMRASHGRRPALIALATRVDELDPPEVIEPPFDDHLKRSNIAAAVRALRRALERHKLGAVEVLPINTWRSHEHDLRWNVDVFEASLLDLLARARPDPDRELRVLLERISDALASVVARQGRGRSEAEREALRDWFVSTLRRLGPTAAKAGDAAERASSSRLFAQPARLFEQGLRSAGATSVADAIETRALRALGARVLHAMFDREPNAREGR